MTTSIDSLHEAQKAMDDVWRYLCGEIKGHNQHCDCKLCEACTKAADGGTLLAQAVAGQTLPF